ncbi:MAG: hypothetical protein ACP6IQ_02535 [Candidatus Njordarchaeia archaeon]
MKNKTKTTEGTQINLKPGSAALIFNEDGSLELCIPNYDPNAELNDVSYFISGLALVAMNDQLRPKLFKLIESAYNETDNKADS